MKQETRHPCWIIMGVSGCGKSSIGQRLADALKVPFVEGDSFHSAQNVAKMAAGTPLNDHDRADWLQALQTQIRTARENNTGLVLSCSALKRRYRDLLRAGDATLRFAHLVGTRDLIAARMEARTGHYMPLSLLDSQLAALEPLEADESGLSLDIRRQPQELVNTILQS
jgi:carbohydrate kinase (thermoresistant glucokinase family)